MHHAQAQRTLEIVSLPTRASTLSLKQTQRKRGRPESLNCREPEAVE